MAAQASIAIENAELYGSVIFDRSTSVYTVRYLTERLDEELSRANRYRRFLSIVILEIGNFADLVSSYGSQKASVVLMKTAQVIKDISRGSDLVARYREKNFAIILHETDDRSIMHPLRRMQKLVAHHSFEKENIQIKPLVGAAIYPLHATDRKTLLEKAEAALDLARDSEEGIYIYK